MEKIYLLEEVEDLVFDTEKNEEWRKTVEELNLEGQKTLIDSEQKSPVPFQFMNTEMVRMFETLCPRKVSIKEYQVTPIPLKVLGIIKLSENEKYFDDVKVWYADAEPDPILVGELGSPKNYYLLARWGDELREFPELLSKAKEIWVERSKQSLEEKIIKCKENIVNIQSLCNRHFRGDWIYID